MFVFIQEYTFSNTLLIAMKTLSLKLDDAIFEETEEVLKEKGMARNRYINEAVDFYNRYYHRKS